MTDRLTQFRWRTAKDGYEWRKMTPPGSDKEVWFITDHVPLGAPTQWRDYVPNTGLFIRLSSLKIGRSEIKSFADEYGLLTQGQLISIDGKAALGESFHTWAYEIDLMSHCYNLWLMLKDGSQKDLAKFIHWEVGNAVTYLYKSKHRTSRRLIAAKETNPELLATFHHADTVQPAWHQLQFALNERLDGAASPRLMWNPGRTRLSLYQHPRDLISALWLQFARAVDGDRKFNQCEECKNWFEIESPDGGRADKRYCGDACRARAWRKSKAASK